MGNYILLNSKQGVACWFNSNYYLKYLLTYLFQSPV